MKKLLTLLLPFLFLVSCAGPSSSEFMMPDGSVAAKIDCVSNKSECFQQASEVCNGGTYQVINSWSNAGGSLKDWMPGPFTWYHMEIECGRTDGKMPRFPFKGQEYVPPKGPTVTKCEDTGSTSVTCKTY